MALTILCIVFTLCLLLGVPVAFSIGISAVATILYEGLPLAVVFQRMTSGMNIFSFLAIPFFIFAGELMLYGGVADRIVGFARSIVGHVRGGLGMANVVACTLFGGVSGSPVADVSATGAVMIPMMKKEGYHADYAVNVTTHAALVGALMPTSHNMIIYSLAAGGKVSITALILAGMVPAALLMACMLVAAYWVAIRRGYPAGTFPGWSAALWSFVGAIPGLFVIAIILVGILSGVFTATESAAIAVIYALLLTIFVHRTLSWDNFLKAAAKAVKTTGIVLLLIGISNTFGYLISLYEAAELTGKALEHLSTNPWVIFFLVNLILFILGTFLVIGLTGFLTEAMRIRGKLENYDRVDQVLEEFVADILVDRLGVTGAVIGFNFHFGKDRRGTPEFLEAQGNQHGFTVDVVPPYMLHSKRVSSGAIRDALSHGHVNEATDLLGYPWFVTGQVVHGDKRGRELGYPTANLRLSPDCGLKYGVYAVRVSVGGQLYDAVANFGRRPMFDTGAVLLEIFLFDFSGDLYGAVLDCAFIGWIRPELHFESVDELIRRMDDDSRHARSILARHAGAFPSLGNPG